MKKYKEPFKLKEKPFCIRCGSYNVKVLSSGEIICQNKSCMSITQPDSCKEVE